MSDGQETAGREVWLVYSFSISGLLTNGASKSRLRRSPFPFFSLHQSDTTAVRKELGQAVVVVKTVVVKTVSYAEQAMPTARQREVFRLW